MHARRVAQRAKKRSGSLTRYSRVALASLASADLEEARWLVERELGPLACDDDDMLRLAATLRVYFEEGSSLERAARRLGVHKNTVNNRVRRARELLGPSLDERPLEVQVALVLSRLVRDD
jgi:DNA-binding PucR family transcriptional regulator